MKQSMSKPVYLMQADPSEICFLDEVLYWAAFQRLPQPFPNIDGNDFRSSSMPGYEVNCAYGGFADDECDRVGLPHDPRNSFDWAYFVTLDDDLETILSKAEENFDKADHDENSWRAVAHSEAMRLHHELEGWKPKYKKATELAKARVYVALKEGRLTAKGVLLPEMDEKKALESLAKEGRTFEDLMDVEIPREFWSFDYILWELSAARNDGAHYCQIHCETEQVLSCFPHDSLLSGLPVQGLERFGSFFVLNDCATMGRAVRQVPRGAVRSRGRPPKYPWDALHLELATLVAGGELPPKKEAGIAHVQNWFVKRMGKPPSRAAISEKLTPYYERFVKNAVMKTAS